MKKFTLVFIALFLAGFLANAQLKLGGKVGVNISRWVYENDSEDDFLFNPGFHGGGIAILQLPFALEIESGILLSQKGVAYDNFFFEGIKYTVTTTYLDIPLKLNLRMEIGALEIFAGGGPTFSLGIMGEHKFEGGVNDGTEDVNWNDPGDPFSLNRTDWGLGFQAGVRVSNLQFSGYFEQGIKNIFYNPQLDETKNLVIGVSLTYFR